MRSDEAAIVAHRLFAAFPESASIKRDGRKPGTRDEYEKFFRDYPRETGDAIVTKAVGRYEWLPKIKHLLIVAEEVAGDASFVRLKDRLLETGKWAVTQTSRRNDGMTLREFFTGELELTQAEANRCWEDRDRAPYEQKCRALEALLAELDERGGHRDAGDPIQAALGIGAGE